MYALMSFIDKCKLFTDAKYKKYIRTNNTCDYGYQQCTYNINNI